MEISTDEVIQINKKFGGNPINLSNLEFDLELANKEKNIFRKNAHLLRGIIGGHPFSNGSKRTAVTVVLKILQKEGLKCDKEKLTSGITNMAKSEVTNIKQIEGRLRKWCSVK